MRSLQQAAATARTLIAALVCFLGAGAMAHAQPQVPRDLPAAETKEQRQAESAAAFDAAIAAGTRGPAVIQLVDQATLQVPAHAIWVPRDAANRLLEAWGNVRNSELTGMVLGKQGDGFWTAVLSYTNSGYIKDNDARDLNPYDVLKNLREATERDNGLRVARGFPALAMGDWLQRPFYDATAKRLIWAFPLTPRDAPGAETTVNYNTRALGRYGYFSLNLLTDPIHFAADKPVADALLHGLAYKPGKTYADFNAGTDHVAEYGLAALIGVVALKKLGLIAIAGAFILKFAKLGVLAVVGVGAAIRKYLARKKGPTGTA